MIWGKNREGQGMVEMGLFIGLVAILALATIFLVADWAGGKFVEKAGSQSQTQDQFNQEMLAKAGGITINSTSTTSSPSTSTAGSSTTSASTSTASSSTTSASTSSSSTTSASTSTTGSSTTSASTSTAGSSTTSASTSTTSSSSSTTSSVTTTVACAPTITSITTSFGCTLSPTGDNALTQKKNTTATYTITLGGTTSCVTHVTVTTISGSAISSYPTQTDYSSPYALTIKTVNASGRSSVVEFQVYENTTLKASFQITISTASSNAC